jgi:hypothetical protein
MDSDVATRLDEATELLDRDRAAMLKALPMLMALEQYGHKHGVLASNDVGLSNQVVAMQGAVTQYLATLADFRAAQAAHERHVEAKHAGENAHEQARRRQWALTQKPELFETLYNVTDRLKQLDPGRDGAVYGRTKWTMNETQRAIRELMATCPSEE